jgi:hypothetical protein
MADKVITINDSQERVDFWSEEISHFFNWKHELLEEYRKKFPELEKEFREKKQISEYKFAPTGYRPCAIRITDGYFYKVTETNKIINYLEDRLNEEANKQYKREEKAKWVTEQ